jgi:hypothetical protein
MRLRLEVGQQIGVAVARRQPAAVAAAAAAHLAPRLVVGVKHEEAANRADVAPQREGARATRYGREGAKRPVLQLL